MCALGDLLCTRDFMALVSRGMKSGATTTPGKQENIYLLCSRRSKGEGSQEAIAMQWHRISNLLVTPRSPSTSVLLLSLSLFYWKSISPSFSLGWVTADVFHIIAELVSFPILFFLPRVSVWRVVHSDVFPELTILTHPRYVQNHSKWARETQRTKINKTMRKIKLQH